MNEENGFPIRLALMRGLILSLAMVVSGAQAQAEGAAESDRTLTGLEVGTAPDGGTRIRLVMSTTAPEPVVFTVDKPARLSVDLEATKLGLMERFKRLSGNKVRSIAAAEAQGRSRIVVELSELVPYTVKADGNVVNIDIQGVAAIGSPVSLGGSSVAGSQINSIDFRRGEKGEGRVVVRMSDPRTVVDVREESGRILAQFRNAEAPTELLQRLDVLDFATPVKFVDVTRVGRDTLIALTPVAGSEFDQSAYQAQDLFTLELQPIVKSEEEARRKEQVFSGERISLSFQNIDVRALLQVIGDVSGNNVVISDGVRGELAMRLVNVPWDQALDIILRTKGLGLQQQGNVMLIAPLDEIAARAKAEGEASKQKDEGAPLRSEIIQINYAKASEISTLLKSADNSLMSVRGKVSVDDRTNTLLVLETRERLTDIRNLIQRLDVPVKQVLIESRIVLANNDFSKSLGTRFGVTAFTTKGPGQFLTTSGSAEATNTTIDSLQSAPPLLLGSPEQRFNVNLPVASAGRVAFAILGSDYLVDLELSALQAEGRGEVTSTPRVITANQKQASIEQGVEIPFQQATSSGATSVTFKKAVLALQVTPQITPDDRIIMDLQVKNDSRGADTIAGPAIDTREVNTQVLVKNGETVVLGGIYQESQAYGVTKVPLLGDLPLLGYLFRTNNTINNKRELLIFVSPRILKDGMSVN